MVTTDPSEEPTMAEITFTSPMPMLSCRDLAAAVAFYRDLVGFRETYRFPDEGEPAFVALELDGCRLGLGSTSNPPIHGRPYEPRSGSVYELCIDTADVDRAVEGLRDAGVPVLVEPCDQPWGERIAYVTDPEDHPVMITQAASGR
jgi:lactoylglutathione lyase